MFGVGEAGLEALIRGDETHTQRREAGQLAGLESTSSWLEPGLRHSRMVRTQARENTG
jgi:hypothetical protein